MPIWTMDTPWVVLVVPAVLAFVAAKPLPVVRFAAVGAFHDLFMLQPAILHVRQRVRLCRSFAVYREFGNSPFRMGYI